MKYNIALAVVTAGFSTLSIAQTERDLDSHEHGSASLNIALEEKLLLVELETPWDNIIGFEHAPKTEAQHAQLDAALDQLTNPTDLFTFSGTNCFVTEVHVDNSLEGAEHDHDDDHDDDHDEEHDDEHDDEHGDEHGSEGDTHSSILVAYAFECDNSDRLTAMDANLLQLWPNFNSVTGQMIGPGGQASRDISSKQIRVDITPIQ